MEVIQCKVINDANGAYRRLKQQKSIHFVYTLDMCMMIRLRVEFFLRTQIKKNQDKSMALF